MVDSLKVSNKKTSRGRPKKEFVSKKPIIKRDKPGRPKKEESIIFQEKREISNKNIAEKEDNKKKDMFILAMFIFSLLLFALSIFVSQKNKENNIQQDNEISSSEYISGDINTNETGNITTGGIIIEETIDKEDQIKNNISPEQILLNNFYEEFNKGSLLAMHPNIDNTLLGSKTFKKFFSKARIQRFLKNISTEGVTINKIENNNQPNPTLTYQISYTIKEGNYFEETRQIKILNKDTPKIGSIKCISTGCSTLPFMNPGKYF